MENIKVNLLLKEIEHYRNKLIVASKEHQLHSNEVVATSEILDRLMNEYDLVIKGKS